MQSTNSRYDQQTCVVMYSERAWAVARHASDPNYDKWYVDSAAHRNYSGFTTAELYEWVDDWVVMVPSEAVDYVNKYTQEGNE